MVYTRLVRLVLAQLALELIWQHFLARQVLLIVGMIIIIIFQHHQHHLLPIVYVVP
jgi:hypothetical protein